MIRDKNIFECIFLENVIHLPHYIVWSPEINGLLRRKKFFSQSFPDMHISQSDKKNWDKLVKENRNKRKVFSLNTQSKTLTELDLKHFFTNAYGYPIKVGENIQLVKGTYKIEKLQILRYAGLIASYTSNGEVQRVNVGNMEWNQSIQCWVHKE